MAHNGTILVVSVCVCRDDEALIIRENKPTAIDEWNFPGGRIEYGEHILNSARREVKEETGFDIKLTGTTGIYNFLSSTNNQVILFHFTGEVIGGSLNLEEDEIVDSKWIKLNELVKFEYEALREPMVLKQILSNLLNEKIHPISIYNELLSK